MYSPGRRGSDSRSCRTIAEEHAAGSSPLRRSGRLGDAARRLAGGGAGAAAARLSGGQPLAGPARPPERRRLRPASALEPDRHQF